MVSVLHREKLMCGVFFSWANMYYSGWHVSKCLWHCNSTSCIT